MVTRWNNHYYRHDKVVVRYRTITAAQYYPLLTVQLVIRFAYRRNTTYFSMSLLVVSNITFLTDCSHVLINILKFTFL